MAKGLKIIILIGAVLALAFVGINAGMDKMDKKDRKGNVVWENRNNRINMADLIDLTSIDTLQLETDTACLIGRVAQLRVCDSGIFVVNDYPNALYRFDWDGHFVGQIGKQGRGPGEYLAIGSMDVDEWNKEVVVFDSENCCFLRYDYTGHFLGKSENDNLPYGDMACLNDSLYVLQNYFHTSGLAGNPELLFVRQDGSLVRTDIERRGMENKKCVLPTPGETIYWAKSGNHNYYIPAGTDLLCRLEANGRMDTVLCLGVASRLFPLDLSSQKYEEQRELGFGPLSALSVTNEGVFYLNPMYAEPLHVVGTLAGGIQIVGQFYAKDGSGVGLWTPLTSYQDHFVCLETNLSGDGLNPMVIFFKYKLGDR